MYFLIILFIIVLIKLYFNINSKEQFLLFNPENTSDPIKDKAELTQYDDLKDYYINKIFEKFEDLENARNELQDVKNEINNLNNENDKLDKIISKNKLRLFN